MAVYAAQIDRVGQGIGRLLTKLNQINQGDNTLFMFLSDNGGCAELLEGASWRRSEPLVWEHKGNRAVRQGQWKQVVEFPVPRKLYDLFADRTEPINLAGNHPKKVSELAEVYADWAERCGVLPWPSGRGEIGTPRGGHYHASQIRS